MKLFALEAMHALRDPPSLTFDARTVRGIFDSAVAGADRRPFRRAVMRNELFFVVPYEMADEIIRMTEKVGTPSPTHGDGQ